MLLVVPITEADGREVGRATADYDDARCAWFVYLGSGFDLWKQGIDKDKVSEMVTAKM